MPDYLGMKNEIVVDPLTRGYAGMTDQQIADNWNKVKDRPKIADTVDSATIFENIDLAEFRALTTNSQVRVDRILSLGSGIKINGRVKSELIAIFGVGSATIANLAASIQTAITRGEELGFPPDISAQMVNNARTGSW